MTIRERLFALEQFGIKLGLENIRALLAALGQPQRAYPTVHVAGTNGKGSVAAMVERGLRAAGHRTGRYTSPHLVSIEERFAIDGRAIDPPAFDAIAGDVLGVTDALVASGTLAAVPTFFEVTTAIGFEAFRRATVDVAVIEVGLGGRFDATNVIEPRAGAITSIDFDHERHLGQTLAAIAYEKAGIAKPGVPLVMGRVAGEARVVILKVAAERGASIVDVERDSSMDVEMVRGNAEVSIRTPTRHYAPVRLSLAGRHQADNALVAVRLLETLDAGGIAVGEDAIRTSLTEAVWPARLERLHVPGGGTVLIDAAHNPSGARALASYLRDAAVSPLPIVIAMMRDKNLPAIVEALLPVASRWVATQVPHQRSRTAAELAEEIRSIQDERSERRVGVDAIAVPEEAVRVALSAYPHAVAAGSIYMVGPLRAALLEGGAMLSSIDVTQDEETRAKQRSS